MGSVQKAKHKILSIRGIDRELGIHIDTVKNYLSAESPPMAQSRVSSKVPYSGRIANYEEYICTEHRHLDGTLRCCLWQTAYHHGSASAAQAICSRALRHTEWR